MSWVWKFPNGSHDDAVDAISGIARMMNPSFDPVPLNDDDSYDPFAFIH